jgi:hypothetical protein
MCCGPREGHPHDARVAGIALWGPMNTGLWNMGPRMHEDDGERCVAEAIRPELL